MLRANPGDKEFRFVARTGSGIFRPYHMVVRKRGDIYFEREGHNLLHFSFHRPRYSDSTKADCHLAVYKELIQKGRVILPENNLSFRFQEKWQRVVGTKNVYQALHIVFPGCFAIKNLNIPETESQIETFKFKENENLNIELLFGPQDDRYWKARFHNYGNPIFFTDLDTGERLCLNSFKDRRDYSVFEKGESYREVIFTDGRPIDRSESFSLGPGGEHSRYLVHGTPIAL